MVEQIFIDHYIAINDGLMGGMLNGCFDSIIIIIAIEAVVVLFIEEFNQ
jgi:hypothetical protein